MTIIDISPALSAHTPVFPGDTAFSVEPRMVIGDNCPVNVSAFSMSTHGGAHADAPLHYDVDGAAIDEVSLDPYLGRCAVIHAFKTANANHAVSIDEMISAMSAFEDAAAERVLIRTYKMAPDIWDPDFRAIAPAVIDHLASLGVRLIGVDTPSLDPASSKTMDAHHAVRRADMRILECLRLDDVQPGIYELIALPLKMKGLDAAPVRAVLRTV